MSKGIRVSLIYGDADYICKLCLLTCTGVKLNYFRLGNWFGGEAVSLAANYTHSEQFRAAGYAPMTVNGTQYGETREYGLFSFTRVYEAGHEVPYYQPEAALALFQRTIQGLAIADGGKLTNTTSTSGPASATHTNSYVPLPSTSASDDSGSSASETSTSSLAINTTMPQPRALNRYEHKNWW